MINITVKANVWANHIENDVDSLCVSIPSWNWKRPPRENHSLDTMYLTLFSHFVICHIVTFFWSIFVWKPRGFFTISPFAKCFYFYIIAASIFVYYALSSFLHYFLKRNMYYYDISLIKKLKRKTWTKLILNNIRGYYHENLIFMH